jgi:hypothetical protein
MIIIQKGRKRFISCCTLAVGSSPVTPAVLSHCDFSEQFLLEWYQFTIVAGMFPMTAGPIYYLHPAFFSVYREPDWEAASWNSTLGRDPCRTVWHHLSDSNSEFFAPELNYQSTTLNTPNYYETPAPLFSNMFDRNETVVLMHRE